MVITAVARRACQCSAAVERADGSRYAEPLQQGFHAPSHGRLDRAAVGVALGTQPCFHNPASVVRPTVFARRRVRYAGCVLFERVYEGCDALCGPSLRVGAALSLREEEEEEGALLGLGAHMGMKMSFTKNPMKPSTAKPSAVRSEILVNSAVPQTPNKHQDLINHEIRLDVYCLEHKQPSLDR